MSLTTLLSGWLSKIEIESPPPADIIALNFGVLKSDKGYMIFLTGSEVYDAADDDWAGEIDYQPPRANKYLLLTPEIAKSLKWTKVLEELAPALKQLVAANSAPKLFHSRTITLGYDDEKLVLIKS